MDRTESNRSVVEGVMEAISEGDLRPFREAMADDFTWIMPTSKMAGIWSGKEAVLRDLMRPLFKQFSTTYRNTSRRIFADGDFVIVECKGDVVTNAGRPYCNDYCYVIRMKDGKFVELTEYLDSALVNEVLDPLEVA